MVTNRTSGRFIGALILLLLSILSSAFQAQAQVTSDEAMSEQILKRDLGDLRVRILNIESDFILPYSATTYFARLYYVPGVLDKIEFRDSSIAETYYDMEKNLATPRRCIRYSTERFKEPHGLNLVQAPRTLVNLTSPAPFNLKTGGTLKLYIKVPLQSPRSIRFFVDRSRTTLKLRTSVFTDDGKKIPFDQIFIRARTVFGYPNIMRGIAEISFMRAGVPVHSVY